MNHPNKLIRQIEAMGWSVSKTNGGHLRLSHPDAAYPVIASSTPAKPMFQFNKVRADMRRALRAKRPP